MSLLSQRLRLVALAAGCAVLAGSPAVAQSGYLSGTIVLASPLQLDGSWNRCEVLEGPVGWNDRYRLDCADEFRAPDGSMVKTLSETWAPPQWIRADDPAFRPDMQIDDIRRQIAEREARRNDPAPPPPPDGPATSVALGQYECWAFNTPRMLLNFAVTGPGQYVASDGSAGTFTYNPALQSLTFSGFLESVMSGGFMAVYHEPRGVPTVSFRGAGGSEAAFCQRA